MQNFAIGMNSRLRQSNQTISNLQLLISKYKVLAILRSEVFNFLIEFYERYPQVRLIQELYQTKLFCTHFKILRAKMKISLNFQTAECIFKKINFLLHQLLKKRISFILFFKLSTPEKLALHSPVKIPFSHNLILMTNNFFYSRNAFLCFMLLFNKIPKNNLN